MAEQHGTSSARATLRAKAKQQETAAASAADEAPPLPSGKGDLASRAAALIAGKPDPGAGAARRAGPDDAGDDDAGDEGGGPDDAGEGKPGEAGPDDQAHAGDDAGDDGDDDDDDAGDAGAPVASLDDAAKRLGMTRQEFNAIPVQVGSVSMTLGELKAKLPEVLKLDQRAAELDDERGSWELERVASYRNINAILDALPRNAVTQGALYTLQRQHEEARNRELESLHFARPKWAESTYAVGAREKIAAMAKDYGFSRAEINGLMDHRVILLAQDYAELRAKVKESRDAARRVSEPGGNRPNGQAGPARAGAEVNNRGPRAKDTQAGLAQRAGAIIRRR